MPGFGSPPRAWGRRREAHGSDALFRFTPTCVGTALRLTTLRSSGTVHPHVRGDGSWTFDSAASASGSPPRAWGRLLSRQPRQRVARFTPTCVGTASEVLQSGSPVSVHPHVRGDGQREQVRNEALGGSPPRAWGRLGKLRPPLLRPRFTPTCVGTARLEPGCRTPSAVHPHVRGDGDFSRCRRAGVDGSPPRAWGRPLIRFHPLHRNRFTPTCVGTAIGRVKSPLLIRGSPPRAWGRRLGPET